MQSPDPLLCPSVYYIIHAIDGIRRRALIAGGLRVEIKILEV
jgi:hypothetical protein